MKDDEYNCKVQTKDKDTMFHCKDMRNIEGYKFIKTLITSFSVDKTTIVSIVN